MVFHKDLILVHYYSIYIYVTFFPSFNADDTTIYNVKEKKESVIITLETSSLLLAKWFKNNFMKTNSDKSPLLLKCSEPSTAVIDGSSAESNVKEVLLGITVE